MPMPWQIPQGPAEFSAHSLAVFQPFLQPLA
jgi:hypothetical protein